MDAIGLIALTERLGDTRYQVRRPVTEVRSQP